MTDGKDPESLRFQRIPLWLILLPILVVPLTFRLDSPANGLITVGAATLGLTFLLRKTVRVDKLGITVSGLLGPRNPTPIAWENVEVVTWAASGGAEVVAILSSWNVPLALTRVRRRLRAADNASSLDRVLQRVADVAPTEQRRKIRTVESQQRSTESVAATLHARGADGSLFINE